MLWQCMKFVERNYHDNICDMIEFYGSFIANKTVQIIGRTNLVFKCLICAIL